MKLWTEKTSYKQVRTSMRVIAVVLLIALITLATGWYRRNYFRHISQLQYRQCSQCYAAAQQVCGLLAAPQKAARNIMTTNTISKSLEQCAQKANMPAGSISRILPARPRRIPQSDYVECQTRVSVENVSLKQLCLFLWNITDSVTGLNINNLHIWAETGNEGLWQAEVTLAGISLVPSKKAELNVRETQAILSEDK